MVRSKFSDFFFGEETIISFNGQDLIISVLEPWLLSSLFGTAKPEIKTYHKSTSGLGWYEVIESESFGKKYYTVDILTSIKLYGIESQLEREKEISRLERMNRIN